MSCADQKNRGSSVMDGLGSNKAKPLKVYNDRESRQFTKFGRCLESIRSLSDRFLKKQEEKTKRSLARLTEELNASKSGMFREIYKKPSSFILLENPQEDPPQEDPAGTSAASSSYHLPKIFSFLHQPVHRFSSTNNSNSGVDVAVDMNIPRPLRGLRRSMWRKSSGLQDRESTSRWLGQKLSRFSNAELDGMFTPQHKLSTETFRHNSLSTLSTFESQLLSTDWQDKSMRSSTSYMSPEDILRCRYLRLSESNISTLLQRCKESGMHIDVHPHMKESDIDITTILSPDSNTVSL